jgi:amphi-Trp domain-containing protein
VKRVTTPHPVEGVNRVTWLRRAAAITSEECQMSDVERNEKLSRQQAAERLTDIAYALTGGGRLRLDGDEEVSIPVADPVMLKRAGKSVGDRAELELKLSWSIPSATALGTSRPPSFQRVAVGYDGGDGARDAIALARLLVPGGDVTLIRVLPRHELLREAAPPPIQHALEERRETLLSETRGAADDLGANATTILADSAAAGLQRGTAEIDADLLIVGSSGGDRVGQILAGGTALRLLHGAPFPTALAPIGFRHDDAALRHVGVGYDGSPEAGAALELGMRLAREHGAAVEITAVVSYEDMDRYFGLPPGGDGGDDPEEALKSRVEKEVRKLSPAVRVSSSVVSGDPVLVLDDRARELDCLVVGSRHHGPLAGVLLGSVTSELVLSLRCPLVVTPTLGDGAEFIE